MTGLSFKIKLFSVIPSRAVPIRHVAALAAVVLLASGCGLSDNTGRIGTTSWQRSPDDAGPSRPTAPAPSTPAS